MAGSVRLRMLLPVLFGNFGPCGSGDTGETSSTSDTGVEPTDATCETHEADTVLFPNAAPCEVLECCTRPFVGWYESPDGTVYECDSPLGCAAALHDAHCECEVGPTTAAQVDCTET